MASVDEMRAAGHAVESTYRVLTGHGCKVAARTYRSWRQSNRPIATRTRSDGMLTPSEYDQAHYAAHDREQQPT